MSLESMLVSLSPSEKLAAMNILWRELSANSAELSSPNWHADVLDARLTHPSAVPPLLVDAAIKDVRDRLDARRTKG
jgi:hypothetical protein